MRVDRAEEKVEKEGVDREPLMDKEDVEETVIK